MSHFVEDTDLVYVTMDSISEDKPPEGVEYIAIKTELTVDDADVLQASAAIVDVKDGKPEASVKLVEYLRTLNAVAFVGWFMLDKHGQSVPYSRKQLGKMSNEDPLGKRAMDEFLRRNPTLRKKPVLSG